MNAFTDPRTYENIGIYFCGSPQQCFFLVVIVPPPPRKRCHAACRTCGARVTCTLSAAAAQRFYTDNDGESNTFEKRNRFENVGDAETAIAT